MCAEERTHHFPGFVVRIQAATLNEYVLYVLCVMSIVVMIWF